MVQYAIDRVKLAEQTFGELDLQRDVLGMFVVELPVLVRAAAATSGNNRSETAHRLKGTAVAIGALSLAEAAAAVEAIPDDAEALLRLEHEANAALSEAAELLRTG